MSEEEKQRYCEKIIANMARDLDRSPIQIRRALENLESRGLISLSPPHPEKEV